MLLHLERCLQDVERQTELLRDQAHLEAEHVRQSLKKEARDRETAMRTISHDIERARTSLRESLHSEIVTFFAAASEKLDAFARERDTTMRVGDEHTQCRRSGSLEQEYGWQERLETKAHMGADVEDDVHGRLCDVILTSYNKLEAALTATQRDAEEQKAINQHVREQYYEVNEKLQRMCRALQQEKRERLNMEKLAADCRDNVEQVRRELLAMVNTLEKFIRSEFMEERKARETLGRTLHDVVGEKSESTREEFTEMIGETVAFVRKMQGGEIDVVRTQLVEEIDVVRTQLVEEIDVVRTQLVKKIDVVRTQLVEMATMADDVTLNDFYEVKEELDRKLMQLQSDVLDKNIDLERKMSTHKEDIAIQLAHQQNITPQRTCEHHDSINRRLRQVIEDTNAHAVTITKVNEELSKVKHDAEHHTNAQKKQTQEVTERLKDVTMRLADITPQHGAA